MNALAAIHVARKQLGLDDDTYRAVLLRVTGKDSARAMSEAERRSVVEAFREKGFKPASKAGRKPLAGKFAKKLQALWIAGWNLGIVRDREDGAMLAFIARQTGIENTRFLLHAADARKAVEGLKGWMAREGGVDWTLPNRRAWLEPEPAKIAWAQFRLLVPGATLQGNERMFADMVAGILGAPGIDLLALVSRQWQAVMNEFGKRIRKGKG